jgi:long-chain acyl-CoA synthetase
MLTHANISANLQQLAVYLPNLEYGQEKFLAVGPFSHIIGMTTVMTLATRYGSEIVMVDRFHPEETTKLCLEQGITMLVGVPTMLAAMNQSEAGRSGNWTALKYVIAGGAPLPLNIKNTFEAMTGARVLTGYGLSETSPAACLTPPDRDPPEGSTGAPMAGTTIEVRDEADVTQTRQINETGEICIRGPQVMVGYWEREDATAETLIEDGLLRTGDIGKIDEHGNVFLVDRLKDIIIASGFNVYPSVIEDALYEHPDIAQAAAIGVPDSYRGETVKAVVVMKPGTKPLDLEALKTFLTGRLSPIEMPKQLELRDALPMSPAGKVLRKDLKG